MAINYAFSFSVVQVRDLSKRGPCVAGEKQLVSAGTESRKI